MLLLLSTGGNSPEEIMSGLFVYSTGELLSTSAEQEAVNRNVDSDAEPFSPRVIEQVDLAPSLALLTGVPVPYTSLGKVVPELFQERRQERSDGRSLLLDAYRENALQVYLL